MDYKIYPIKIGEEITDGPVIYYLTDFGKRVKLTNLMWLIKNGKNIIMIDTGFTQGFARKFEPGVTQKPEEHPFIQLKNLGVKPEDVTHLIITHCHYDHFSSIIFEYKRAKIFIQKKELDFAINPPHPWFNGLIDKETVNKLCSELKSHVETIEGDAEILPGIEVFWTGGHTPGHQSVKVSTSGGTGIITGDVVFTYRNIEEDIPVGVLTDLIECYAAMERIRKTGDIILPGHEGLVFERWGNIILYKKSKGEL